MNEFEGDLGVRVRYLTFLERALRLSEFDYTDMIWWRINEYGIQDDKVHVFVNCNDFFHWACSDLEEITLDNIDLLESTIQECEEILGGKYRASDAFLLWCCRVREMRPQGAYYAHLDEELWDLFDAAGPEREPGFGDPSSNETGKQKARDLKAEREAKLAEAAAASGKRRQGR